MIYENDAQYLMDELKRLDIILRIHNLRMKSIKSDDGPFRGFYISDEEAANLLAGDSGAAKPESEEIPKLLNAKTSLEKSISDNLLESTRSGKEPKLRRLADTLALSSSDIDALIICAAAGLDPKYECLYGYFHDDLTRKQPSPGLMLEILCRTPEERLNMRIRFLPGAPLIDHKILEPVDGSADGLLLSSGLRLNPDILGYILGIGSDMAWRPPARPEIRPISDYYIPGDIEASIANLISRLEKNATEPAIVHIQGRYGSGRRAVADKICSRLNSSKGGESGAAATSIPLDLASYAGDRKGLEAAINQSLKDSELKRLPVCISGLDSLVSDDPRGAQLMGVLSRALASFQGLAILISQEPPAFGREIQSQVFRIHLPLPRDPAREEIWKEIIAKEKIDGNLQNEVSALASKFRFTAGQIADALAAARNLSILEGRDSITLEDLYEGCRIQSSHRISSLARWIKPRYSLKDVVLPDERKEQLREIKSYIDHRSTVYGDWGFEDKLSLGKGVNVLFSGESGTGKTMAAEAIANELGLELYKIDLSSVISKYIGETEKNLSQIFAEAEQSNAILFFDEADAIFGKRSEVKDAHDRYANVEISYLLQKMEEHQGIVILATNFSKNMDEAFLRRMQFLVEFPFPEEEYRLRIWKSLLPERAKAHVKATEEDFRFLARKFRISGGNIKNILVSAAFLAAARSIEEERAIRMEDFIIATGKEMRKIGRICSQSDFGKYYNLISA